MSVERSLQGVMLYDSAGNPMEVKDGVSVPTETQGLLHHALDGTGHARRLGAMKDGSYWRLMVESKPAARPLGTRTDFVRLSGSEDLLVNGTSPKEFTFPCDASVDLQLEEIAFVMSALKINHNGDAFGQASALSNGLKLDLTINDGDTYEDIVIKINEDFIRLTVHDLWQGGLTDVLSAKRLFGGEALLKGGTGDEVKVTVRDNLTSPSLGAYYLTCTVRALEA